MIALAFEFLLASIAASVVIIVATLARVAWLAFGRRQEAARETLRLLTNSRWPRSGTRLPS